VALERKGVALERKRSGPGAEGAGVEGSFRELISWREK
jgi:hypothetical protein